MKGINLFGVEQEYPEDENKHLSKYQIFKKRNHYRDATDNKKCKTCKSRRTYACHNKYYHKCRLLGDSNSQATDIRLKKVCDKWEGGTWT